MKIEISTTAALRGADVLMRAWDCGHPKTPQDARLAGYALMVCFYPSRIPDITARAHDLQQIIDAALKHQPDFRPRVLGDALHDALDTSDALFVEVICNLCGLVKHNSDFLSPSYANSVTDVDVDGMYARSPVVNLAARRK